MKRRQCIKIMKQWEISKSKKKKNVCVVGTWFGFAGLMGEK